MQRHAFIPNDYRLRVVLGWLSPEDGFTPDEPLEVELSEGILLPVERSSHTPTIPPPAIDPKGVD